MKEEKIYLETLREIKLMKKQIANEMDSLHADMQNLHHIKVQIKELQEELAKLAGEPVGMLFTYYRA
jgi:DNA repair ATPase RecN